MTVSSLDLFKFVARYTNAGSRAIRKDVLRRSPIILKYDIASVNKS